MPARRILALGLVAGLLCPGGPADACSLVYNRPVVFDPSLAGPADEPPPAPTVQVVEVKRGGGGGPAPTGCSDMGAVVLAISATETSRDLAYQFEQILGDHEAGIFLPPAGEAMGAAPAFEGEGRLYLVFHWIDGTDAVQEPFYAKVRVTAFLKSGMMGESTILEIKDPGRQ